MSNDLLTMDYIDRQLIMVDDESEEIRMIQINDYTRKILIDKYAKFTEYAGYAANISKILNPQLALIIKGAELTTDILKSRQIKETHNKNRKIVKYLKVPKNLAKDINWLPMHPQNNVVYVGHPINPKVYFPAAKFHEFTFQSKWTEALRLLQGLKAKYIRAEYEAGWDINASLGGEVGGIKKFVGGKAKINTEMSNSTKILFEASYEDHNFLSKIFNKPVIPENLLWYPHESNWQSIAEGRIQNNLKEICLEINYCDDFGINSNIEAAFAKIPGVSLGGDFAKHVKTVWKLRAEF